VPRGKDYTAKYTAVPEMLAWAYEKYELHRTTMIISTF